jgi:hypothetical protein
MQPQYILNIIEDCVCKSLIKKRVGLLKVSTILLFFSFYLNFSLKRLINHNNSNYSIKQNKIATLVIGMTLLQQKILHKRCKNKNISLFFLKIFLQIFKCYKPVF